MSVLRTAMVTGAGRGIGRGIAIGLAAAGYRLALVGRTRSNLDAVAEELGGSVFVATADLIDPTEVDDAVARAEDELGGLGLLVNNAGVIEREATDFVGDDVEDTWRVIEANVRGPLLVTHAVLPGMLARGSGRVVNLNSGAGHRAMTEYTGYAISKGALARFTTQLDAQYRDRGLRVLDLAPGHVQTQMTTSMPMHAGRTSWTPIEAVAELVRAFGDGELDALSGRFVRAGTDTVESLRAATAQILATDARTLSLGSYGADDRVG
ncbi:SDR family NAD(P)-dependent oxidoreductase [Cellulomonas sp. McL0617]|uniref:SDR family NAD(P)-dependent oxidoreductase n=1 Tax=Cellulomonas sp. McL0617 TaxID=3415675 RepID=UPI003CEADD19